LIMIIFPVYLLSWDDKGKYLVLNIKMVCWNVVRLKSCKVNMHVI